jgi:hypothetical protein
VGWQRKPKADQQERKMLAGGDGRASFTLVSEEAGSMSAGLELVPRNGRRLRIRQVVEEAGELASGFGCP